MNKMCSILKKSKIYFLTLLILIPIGCIRAAHITSVVDVTGRVKSTSVLEVTKIAKFIEVKPDDPCENIPSALFQDFSCEASLDGKTIKTNGWKQLSIEEFDEKNGYFRLKQIPSMSKEVENNFAVVRTFLISFGIDEIEAIHLPGEILWANTGEVLGNILKVDFREDLNTSKVENFEVVIRGKNATGDVPWKLRVQEHYCIGNINCFIEAAEECEGAYWSDPDGIPFKIEEFKEGTCMLYRPFMEDDCAFQSDNLVSMLKRWKDGQFSDKDWDDCEVQVRSEEKEVAILQEEAKEDLTMINEAEVPSTGFISFWKNICNWLKSIF